VLTILVEAIEREKHLRSPATLLFVAAALSLSTIAKRRLRARLYLNAPIDSCLPKSSIESDLLLKGTP
jgi:hypothetical protein